MSAHPVVLEIAAVILLFLFLCQLVLKELNKTVKTTRGIRKMIGLKDDGLESLRYKLRAMSDRDLIQFGKAARERCKDRRNEQSWTELKLARAEWRSRHPIRQR